MRPWTSRSRHSRRYSACVGMMPQHEIHNLVVPNHFGSHVVLTVLRVIKCSVRVSVFVCVCVCTWMCVLYDTATTKLTLQIPHLKEVGSENVQDL